MLRFSLFSGLLLLMVGLGTYLPGRAQSVVALQTLLDEADRETNPQKAIGLYSDILKKHPEQLEAQYGRAVVYTQIKQYSDALTDVQQVLRQRPNLTKAIAQRAYLYVQLDDYDRAIDDYKRAIALEPSVANYYSGLSYCLTKHNRYTEALQTAQRGIDLAPAAPNAYRNRGRARLYSGQLNEAIADFETSLRLKHAEAHRVYTDLGEAFEQKNDLVKAMAFYQKALSLDPGYTDAEVRRAVLEQRSGMVAPTATFSGRRVALVVGNAHYNDPAAQGLGQQPLNDARAMSRRLRELGFAVDSCTDAGYVAMNVALSRFYQQAKGADVALLFYAGHGAEHRQTNYLLPTDIRLDSLPADGLGNRAVSIATIIDRLQDQQPKYCVIILDACRDDPFAGTPPTAPLPTPKPQPKATIRADSLLAGRGFRPVRVESRIRNCCIALATAPGATARNGPRQNGFYTEALLRFLHRGRRLDDVFADARGEVISQTSKAGHPQFPEFINRTIDRMIL
jgi:tetratricopeptide (TPR) repeat protein